MYRRSCTVNRLDGAAGNDRGRIGHDSGERTKTRKRGTIDRHERWQLIGSAVDAERGGRRTLEWTTYNEVSGNVGLERMMVFSGKVRDMRENHLCRLDTYWRKRSDVHCREKLGCLLTEAHKSALQGKCEIAANPMISHDRYGISERRE